MSASRKTRATPSASSISRFSSTIFSSRPTVSFWNFFTVFHEIFFKGDSWLFLYSDTLIRLFPLPFWESAFAFVGILDVAAGLALGLGLKGKAR